MSQLNLTHINSYFITSKLHGELVSCLDQSELRQRVYVPISNSSHIDKHQPKGLVHSSIHYAHCYQTLDRFLWPLKMNKIWWDFQKWFAPNQSEIIHAHSLVVNGLIAYRAFKKWGIPYVVSVRFSDIHFFLEKALFFKKLAKNILANASAIVFISPAYRNIQIQKFFSGKEYQMILDKSMVIPNGINEYWIKNTHSKNNLTNIRNLIFVGSLIKRKNLKSLIEACDILNRDNFQVQLSVVGDGPLLNKLKNHSSATEVVFHGNVNHRQKLLELYRSSDVLVVPSFIETFGLIYPEAMSQGLPVIYTRGQGFDGYFPDGHVGYAVNPKSPHDISEKIKLVFDDYMRFSNNAFEASKAFLWDNSATQLRELYDQVLNKAQP